MLVVGVNGSPHERGNTGFLVRKVLEGAQQQGAETKILDLGKMRLSPCVACATCKKGGRPSCSIEDDMYEFYDLADQMKAIVVGTPIYFDHVSAQLKAFLDRLYPYIGAKMERYFPTGVKAGIVITYGASGENAYDGVIDWTRGRLKGYYGIETVGCVKVGKCDIYDSANTLVVDRDEQLISQALELGARLLDHQSQVTEE